MDPHTDHPALQAVLASASSVYRLYNQEKQLQTAYPHDINRLSRDQYGLISAFFMKLLNDAK